MHVPVHPSLSLSVCVCVCVCEWSVADSADSEHLIGSVDQIRQQFIRSVRFLGSHSGLVFRSKTLSAKLCLQCHVPLIDQNMLLFIIVML